jgi:radical SAM protein with 4Fe4S-binding SPASM domain
MDKGLAFSLIDSMRDIGVQTCKILGGEPSIYPHIIDILKYLKKSGIRSVIISNGILYAKKDLIEKHFDVGLDSLIISLKAATGESYKNFTGADVFMKVRQAIKNLRHFKGGVTITITSEMATDILTAIDFVVASGAKFINLHFCSPTLLSGTPVNHSMLPPDEAAKTLIRAVNHLDTMNLFYNVQISIPFCNFPKEFIKRLMEKNCLTSGCIVNKKSGIIFDTQGGAGFCNHMMDYPFAMHGKDYKNGHELERIYFKQDDFFEVTNRAPSKKCLDCSLQDMCCGGCPLQWTQFEPDEYIIGESQ